MNELELTKKREERTFHAEGTPICKCLIMEANFI